MATWPATLPVNPLADSFKPVPPPLVIRSEFDFGTAFQRRRATAGPWAFPELQFVLTPTQVSAFQTFWTEDINDGASVFDFDVPAHWPVPGAGSTQVFRITGQYLLTAVARGVRWNLQVDMEMLP